MTDHDDATTPALRWLQTAIAVFTIITAVYTAYFTLDKRIALLEQKIDFIVSRVKP